MSSSSDNTQMTTPPNNIPDDNVLLAALDPSFHSPEHSISSEILESALPTILDATYPVLPRQPMITSPITSPLPIPSPITSMDVTPIPSQFDKIKDSSKKIKITPPNTTETNTTSSNTPMLLYTRPLLSTSTIPSTSAIPSLMDIPLSSPTINPGPSRPHDFNIKIVRTVKNNTPPQSPIKTPPVQTFKYDIAKDPQYLENNYQPPVLHPYKSTTKLSHIPKDFFESHPEFKINLISLYLTPTDYKFHFTMDRSEDHFVAFASRQMNPHSFWQSKRLKFFQLMFTFLRPTPQELSCDTRDPEVLSLRSKEQHHYTYQTFLNIPSKHNYIFQNHKFTSPFSFHLQYRIDQKALQGTIRNYDALKQYYLFTPNLNPSRPLIVPQEYLIISNDALLPANIPSTVSTPFAPLESLLKDPLDDNCRSYYTSLVHKSYSYNELLFIVSKLTQYIFKKQYKYVPQSPSKRSKPFKPPHTIKCNNFEINPSEFTQEILTLLDPYIQKSPHLNPIHIFKSLLSNTEKASNILQSALPVLNQLQSASDTLTSSINTIVNYNSSPDSSTLTS